MPTLPDRLENLNCQDNKLTSLPSFPDLLSAIHCNNNLLTSLPSFSSDNFDFISCENNQLTSLPKLPANLLGIDCSNNQLTLLPQFPMEIEYVNCSHNLLTSLPNIPKNGLDIISCADNPLIKFDNYDDYLIKNIIYAIAGTQNLNIFINLVLDSFVINCLECDKEFILVKRYIIEENHTIKISCCDKCIKIV